MLNQTDRNLEEAKRITSFVAWRIGMAETQPEHEIISFDEAIKNISHITAKTALLKLYGAIIVLHPQQLVAKKSLLEGILWLLPRCDHSYVNFFAQSNLSFDDDIPSTQLKLIELHDRKFFYEQFVAFELQATVFKLINQYNNITQKHFLAENIGSSIQKLTDDFFHISLLNSHHQHSHNLLEKARKAITIKTSLEDYIAKVNEMMVVAKNSIISSPPPQPVEVKPDFISLYRRKSSSNNNDFNIMDVIRADDSIILTKEKRIVDEKYSNIVRGKVLTALKKNLLTGT